MEPVVGVSKTDLLRDLIIEKLTIAAQQIFAVVERTVAGYEEEASGFRQELEQQRRQLEVVLQPEIKVETTDEQLFPPQGVAGGGLPEDEEQHKYEPSVGFSGFTEAQVELDGFFERPAQAPTQDQDRLAGLDHEGASRCESSGSELCGHACSQPVQPVENPPVSVCSAPSVESGRNSLGGCHVIKPQTHVGLKIRILEDSATHVLSTSVFQKSPLHELQCPCGLREADFLDLLRSTFPQLAAGQPFDLFVTDNSKRLHLLRVNVLTPEEISRSIKARGSGKSSLYIRLKAQEEPSWRSEAAAGSLSSLSETLPHPRLLSPEEQLAMMKHLWRRDTEPPAHIDLKVRVLEDSHVDVLNLEVFNKYPMKKLQFPCGLQEADFLSRLRSTFPQLAANEPFDVFTTDHTKRLHPLKHSTLTPEEIHRIIKSRGSGHSSLYIRLKEKKTAAKVVPSTSAHTRPSPRVQSDKMKPSKRPASVMQNPTDVRLWLQKGSHSEAPKSKGVGFICYTKAQMEQNVELDGFSERPAQAPTQDQDRLAGLDHEGASRCESSGSEVCGHACSQPVQPVENPPVSVCSAPSVKSGRNSLGGRHVIKPQTHVGLKIRILEDSATHVLSTSVFQKYPLHELQCPCGLREADFLDLLRSTFPQLADGQPFDLFVTDNSKRLHLLRVNVLTPEEISRSIKARGSGKSSLYIRLKAQQEHQAAVNQPDPSRREGAAGPSPSTPHPRLPPAEGNRGEHRDSDPEIQIHFRIRVLDSHINMLTNTVFQKYPLQELQCPCGLREADFLDLLRSTFPQLAAGQPFDLFITDNSKKLHPLRVNALTPEEICRCMLRSGSGKSSLYIRLKAPAAARVTDARIDLSQREEAPSSSSQTRPHMGLLLSRLQVAEGNPGRCGSSSPQSHVGLKVRVLEDSLIDVLTWRVFQKYPARDVYFPRGLQEADFLNRLRSTFPQLPAGKPFDIFTTDKTRKLQPLRVHALTPEEVRRAAGNSSLYIRVKSPEKLQSRKKHLPLLHKDVGAAAKCSLSTSSPALRVRSDRKMPRRRPMLSYMSLKVRFLGRSQVDVLNSHVFKKFPLQQLQCPRGLQEADFLGFLRASFPQLAPDKPFDIFISDKSKRLCRLKVNPLTPEEIHRAVRLKSVLYLQLKAEEATRRCAETVWRREGATAKHSASMSDHSRVGDLTIGSRAETKAEPADEPESLSLWSLQSLLPSDSDGCADWDPDGRDGDLGKMTKRRRVEDPNSNGSGDARPSCKVCRARRGSTKTLIKHAWSHVDDPESRCGLCGGAAGSAEELRSHLQSHLRTHSCSICGECFLTVRGLKGHLARHQGAEGLTLSSHAGEEPYSCGTCRKPFARLEALTQHVANHGGHARARAHACDACGQRFYTGRGLQLHLRGHARGRQQLGAPRPPAGSPAGRTWWSSPGGARRSRARFCNRRKTEPRRQLPVVLLHVATERAAHGRRGTSTRAGEPQQRVCAAEPKLQSDASGPDA